ncbi:MAG: hypothetical protein ABIH69_07595 [bacterium]
MFKETFTIFTKFSLRAFLFVFLLVFVSLTTSGGGCSAPSEKHVGPAPDSYEVQISSTQSDLQIDGESSIGIITKVKENGNYIEGSLPDHWSLYVDHDYAGSTFYIPEQDVDKYSSSLTGEVSIIEVDPISVTVGIPNYISSQIAASLYETGAQIILEVLNSAGTVIYTFAETMSEDSATYNFHWDGKSTGGSAVAVGSYQARVKVGKYDAESKFNVKATSQSVTVYIEGEIGTGGASIPFISGQSKLTLVAPAFAEHLDRDTIRVSLKNASGLEVASNSEDPLVVTFKDPRLYRVTASSIPQLTVNTSIEGIPVSVDYLGTDGESKEIVVRVFEGDANSEVTYILNMDTKNITIWPAGGGSYTISYGSEDYDNAGYIIADLINKIQEEAFDNAGITRNSSDNVHVEKDLHGASLEIREIEGEDKREYTLTVKGEEYVFEFDKTTGSLLVQEGVDLQEAYSINPAVFDTWLASLEDDYFAGAVATGVSASGVKAQSISSVDFQKLIMIAVIAPTVLSHTANYIIGTILAGISLGETLEPHPYLGPVTIDYGYPTDGDFNALKILRGTALPFKTVNIYRGDGSVVDSTTANSAGQWEISTDNGYDEIDLSNGKNKLNAVVEDDGRRVESGYITVFKGDKKFAITSPREGQVVWGEFNTARTKLNCKINVEGFVQTGKAARVRKLPDGAYTEWFYANDDWIFQDDGYLDMELDEGENEIEIEVDGEPIIKKVIASYKFENTSVGKNYAIRKGDMLFVSKQINNPFDVIPKEPDHNGIYVGNRNIVEAVLGDGVVERDIDGGGNPDYLNSNFYFAVQPKKNVVESIREQVVANAKKYKEQPYDWPFAAPALNFLNFAGQQVTLNILGHYNGATNGFYCSELGYYVWEEAVGASNIVSLAGIDRSKMMWPWNNDELGSLLPAKLGEELMECRRVE